jgi:uncharacterized protein YegP (UPF0339 family)
VSARFEIVRSDAVQPWHARFVAANGRIVWTTEKYARRVGALRAIDAITDGRGWASLAGGAMVLWRNDLTEVRDVDERTP